MVSKEGDNQSYEILGAPAENFAGGLLTVDIPELGPKIQSIQGKVRDIYRVDGELVMITTDRQSAYDRMICTIPGKGQVLNLLSTFWFSETRNIFPNHMIAVPHPNVLIAQEAEETLPVEVVLRRYIARSSTLTSVYYNYFELGRREIYGIEFPEGLKPNQELPMGTILTPTTKSKEGHDEELTDWQAQEIVDGKFGRGIWIKAKTAALALFERAGFHHRERNLILVDTKYEIGIKDGKLMLIDELHTPDSSRLWKADTYPRRFEKGENPETFDKEILRRWLGQQPEFDRGKGKIPRVPQEVIEEMSAAYRASYKMITGQRLPETPSDPGEIRAAILSYFEGEK